MNAICAQSMEYCPSQNRVGAILLGFRSDSRVGIAAWMLKYPYRLENRRAVQQ